MPDSQNDNACSSGILGIEFTNFDAEDVDFGDVTLNILVVGPNGEQTASLDGYNGTLTVDATETLHWGDFDYSVPGTYSVFVPSRLDTMKAGVPIRPISCAKRKLSVI